MRLRRTSMKVVFVSDNNVSISTEIVIASLEADDEPGKLPADHKKVSRAVTGRPSKKSLAHAQRELNDNQLRFAAWLSLPDSARPPGGKTYAEFANLIGVHVQTLNRWAKLPDVLMATRWLQLNSAGNTGRVADVIDFLYETSMDTEEYTKNRLTAARDFLKATGVFEVWGYDNKLMKVKSVDEFDLDELSDEELWDLYQSRIGVITGGE